MLPKTAILSLFLILQNAAAQSPATPDLGARVLPSLVRLSIQKSDGGTASANGFLAVKDGVLAVPWHVVRDARSVVARFSSGEEYECSGIIDRDEKRNVALVRIKVFGKPVLKMDAREPAAGSALAVAAVKDGSFGMIGAT
ncbi:MAG: hypothetical protein JXP48_13605, partial [Acidobacteria bacterium]|nr:hypothetical protein [Acidobacteriota bacterium]